MIVQLDNKRFYAQFNGELSAVGFTTADRARAHLDKLQRGLVQFAPLRGSSEHKPLSAEFGRNSYKHCRVKDTY